MTQTSSCRQKTRALLILMLLPTSLLCPPEQALASLTHIGQNTSSLFSLSQKDTHTVVLAAGAAAVSWFGLSALKSLWNRQQEQPLLERLSQVEADMQTLKNTFPEKDRLDRQHLWDTLIKDAAELQEQVLTLKQELPFWGKLGPKLKEKTDKLGIPLITVDQFADLVIKYVVQEREKKDNEQTEAQPRAWFMLKQAIQSKTTEENTTEQDIQSE